ncbi:MAG: PAS domain S-box protein, partial [Rhodocyclaceae bacterium]|nr:PAS domain S-box protein [Rhodocyclaceae bacterium]
MKIPHRLLAGVVLAGGLVAALVWGVLFLSIDRSRHESMAQAQAILVLRAQMYAEATRPLLRQVDERLRDLRDHWDGDPQAMAAAIHARQPASSDTPFRIRITSADGTVPFVMPPDAADGADSGTEALPFHSSMPQRDVLFVGAATRTAPSAPLQVHLSRPIHAGQRFMGVIEITLEADALTHVDEILGLGEFGVSYILQEDGRVLTRHPQAPADTSDVLAPLAGTAIDPPSGTLSFTDPIDGIERLYGYAHLPDYGWTFVAAEALSEALAPHQSFRRSVLAGGALATLAAAIVLFTLYRARLHRLRAQAGLDAKDQQLADRERLLSVAFESLPIGIALSDPAGRLIYGNRQAAEILGVAGESWLGRPIDDACWQIVRSDGSPMPPDAFASTRALREQRRIDGIEMGLVRPEGIRWLIASAVPSPDPSYGVIVAFSDITATRRTESVLARQRHLTKSILDTLGDLVWLKDDAGVYITCNARFERFFGASEAEIQGRTDHDFVDAALADFFRAKDREAMEKNGPSINQEWVTFAADGHSELLETTKTPMFDESGELIGILGVGHDITEARALQEALEASHRDLLKAQAVARLGSWSIDLASGQVAWSPVTYTLFGLPEGQPVDVPTFLSLVFPDDRESVEAAWRDALDTGHFDIEHRTLVEGEVRWFRERADFVRNADGWPVSALGTVQDITERRRLEDALRHQQQRLEAIIEGTNVGTWEWNVQTGEAEFNERWAELIGFTLDELRPLSYDTWLQAVHPGDRPQTQAAMLAHFSGESETFESEFRMRHKRGYWVWVLALGRVNRRTMDGAPLRMSGTILDITVRKATEEALSALAGAMTQLSGASLYQAISQYLADALDLDFVFTGRLDEGHARVQVVAGWSGDAPMSPFAYALADTPCADAMKRSTAIFPEGVSRLFPRDELLEQMGITSYIGSSLFGKSGQPMGILVGLGRKVIHRTQLAQRLFGVFVDSVSAEMMRVQAEETVIAARNRLDAILQTTQDAVWLLSYEGQITDVNPAACALSGYSRSEMLSRQIADIDAVQGPAQIALAISGVRRTGSARFESCHRTRAGELLTVDIAINDLPAEALMVAFIRDISARREAEEGLRQAASVFEFSHEGIMITDTRGMIIDVNEAFCRITGFTREEAIGSNPRILKSGRHDDSFYASMWQGLQREGHWSSEVWNRREDGVLYAQRQTISAVRDGSGEVLRYVCLFSDITELKEHQHQLERIAHYDALTGLPNRVLLADRIRQAMAQARRHDTLMAVAFLDLDGFKTINDRHSHEVGDRLLTHLAGRMQEALRQIDTLSRLGGDEFVALLVDLESPEASAPIIDRLLATASEPTSVDGVELRVSASIGVSFYPQAVDVDGDQLLRQADQAMYLAKQAGKNRFQVFDVEHDRSIRGRHESLERIGLALARQEFVLFYQPRVNMRTGDILGAEALIRWQHPERGLLPPAAFLPTVKNNPLTEAIGAWVLETALAQIEAWHELGLNVPVSVNVDARQLDRPDFMDTFRSALARHPTIRPGDLELEVLETSALEDIEQISEIIEACGALGVHFALDDFGTGYSSLTYLRRLPARNLKIDQSFVRGMLDSPEDLAILGGVLSLAEAFRRQAIAEGVESVQHGNMLIQMGCVIGQGYAIARPMPAEAFPAWAEEWRPDQSWRVRQPLARSDVPVIFAMVEHHAWIVHLQRFLAGESASPPTLDPHQCQFGHWLDDTGRTRHGSHPAFQKVQALHEAVHQGAAELLALKHEG